MNILIMRLLTPLNHSYAMNELAFQSLPRGLRRRTASHNLNRLPARLRAKAAKEVEDYL